MKKERLTGYLTEKKIANQIKQELINWKFTKDERNIDHTIALVDRLIEALCK